VPRTQQESQNKLTALHTKGTTLKPTAETGQASKNDYWRNQTKEIGKGVRQNFSPKTNQKTHPGT